MAHMTLCVLTLLAALLTQTLAQNATVTTTTTATALTRTVNIFYLSERASGGLPYTLFRRDSGSVVAVDTVNSLTTYVITTTRVDGRTAASPTGADDNATTAIPTLGPTRSKDWPSLNGTGQPSTITQGPATFMFTGARFAPDHTVYFFFISPRPFFPPHFPSPFSLPPSLTPFSLPFPPSPNNPTQPTNHKPTNKSPKTE
jgi:hypothetical protein